MRVFAVAIVVGIALSSVLGGLGDFARDVAAIGIVSILTLIYTFEGGMAAVIWTDVVQLAVYVTGTLVGFFTILHLVPGGWHTVHGMAAEAGKFRVFYFGWNFYQTYTFWSGLIGGAFLTTASHGTDQLIVQRLLSSRSERQAKLALLASGVMVLFQFSLFLLVGAMLFVFYRLFPPGMAFTRSDTIYPTFIVTRMPHGVSGLLISAILAAAMANLSAALNSLSSTTIVDFYSRLESAGERAAPGISVAAGDGGLGRGAVCAGDCGAARRTGSGGGTVDCLRGLRFPAGSVSAGRADAARHRGGSDGGNALRLWAESVPVAVHPGSLHLVCGAGERGDLRGGLWREFLYGTGQRWTSGGDGSGDKRWQMIWTRLSALEIATRMNRADARVLRAVRGALPAIAEAIEVIRERLARGGRLIYVGSGTSGRIGALDASECPPTFGTAPAMVQAMIAGGDEALGKASEGSEDSAELGASDMAGRRPGRKDVVVGLSASGQTPYTGGGPATCAERKGAATIAVVCRKGSELAKVCGIAIEAEVGAEVLEGSTRLKAGTAQKMICNMLTTGAMARLGYVYGNLMVQVQMKNAKLVERGIAIVRRVAKVERAWRWRRWKLRRGKFRWRW